MSQRASAARSAFDRAMAPPAKRQPATDPQAEAPATAEATDEAKPSKYTLLLAEDAAAQFDRLTLEIRQQLGRAVKKSDLVRALVSIAADDPTLRNQVAEEIRGRSR